MKAIDFEEQPLPKLEDDPQIVFSNKKSSDLQWRIVNFQRLLNTQPGIFLIPDGAWD